MSRACVVVRFDALAEIVLATPRDDGVNQPLAEFTGKVKLPEA